MSNNRVDNTDNIFLLHCNILLTGSLGGAEDHYTHIHDVLIPPKHSGLEPLKYENGSDVTDLWYSGLDLWDNQTPVTDQTGIYSTHLFTRKAEGLIRSHDTNKVW